MIVLDKEKAESELFLLSKEIEKALFDSEILRSHLTIEIKTPESWKQEYRVVYRNKRKEISQSDSSLNCIRLPPRRKKVQRNLSVYDRKGNRLTVIPSELVNKALTNICEFYLSKVIESLRESYRGYFQGLGENHIDFEEVFTYDGNSEVIQEVRGRFREIIMKLESELEPTEKGLIFLRRIYVLVSICKNFYIPIVKLEKPLESRDCILISYSVENLTKPSMSNRKTSMSNWSLYLQGKLTLSFPLELEPGISNHIRILSPPGMMFRKAGISGLEKAPELYELFGDLDKFLDENMIYFHISKENSNKIVKLERKRIVEGREKIKIKAKIGIDKDFPRKPSLIRNLLYIMYFSAFIPLFSFLFSYKDFVFGFNVISASVLIVIAVLVSLGVYSMDKVFLHGFMAGQVLVLVIIYAIELLAIIPFW